VGRNPFKMRTTLLYFILLLPVVAAAQFGSGSNRCVWKNEAMMMVTKQYLRNDTSSERLKISMVKIAAARDTMSGGISVRNVRALNCSDCMQIRYDEQGRTEWIYNNVPDENNRIIKTQFVYDDQHRVKYEIVSAKDLGNEYDTAYHMNYFVLYKYANQKQIQELYLAEYGGLSDTPNWPAMITRNFQYNKQNQLITKTTKSLSGQYDSLVYKYSGDTVVLITAFNKEKQMLYTEKKWYNNHMLLKSVYNSDYYKSSMELVYTYDAGRRCIGVHQTGGTPDGCSRSNAAQSKISYDKNGFPKFVHVSYTQSAALLFFYETR
jgi:hypothetical protein